MHCALGQPQTLRYAWLHFWPLAATVLWLEVTLEGMPMSGTGLCPALTITTIETQRLRQSVVPFCGLQLAPKGRDLIKAVMEAVVHNDLNTLSESARPDCGRLI